MIFAIEPMKALISSSPLTASTPMLASYKREDACAFLEPSLPYQIQTNGNQFTQPPIQSGEASRDLIPYATHMVFNTGSPNPTILADG